MTAESASTAISSAHPRPAAILRQPPTVCAVLVYLRTGPDKYQIYSLEGGP